jgi:carbonic anhydrase/acetyltransferase-like protein (isoleucine patch superfamily)
MPIYALDDLEPDAFVHPDAVVIGRVTIEGYRHQLRRRV